MSPPGQVYASAGLGRHAWTCKCGGARNYAVVLHEVYSLNLYTSRIEWPCGPFETTRYYLLRLASKGPPQEPPEAGCFTVNDEQR